MTLDRAELAARLAEADWRNPRAEPLPLGEWGRTLVAYADDLIAALALTPPVAGPCPGEDARDDAEARKRIDTPVAPKSEAATPSPEATRPTLVDVERSAEAFANHKGDIPHSPSDAWMDGWLARDRAVAHDGIAHSTNAAPAPVEPAKGEARDEAYKALLAYAECDYATCYSSERDWQEVYARHGWTGGDDSYSWLRGMCGRALSLAKSALTPQVRA